MVLVQKELQNAYIGEYPWWWEPWANTVAYYKFDWNLNDSSGNDRNLSMYTWSFTYSTLSSWQQYCRLNTAARTANYTIPFNRTAYTISWWYSWDTISTQYQKIIVDLKSGDNYRPRVFNWGGWWNYVYWVVSFDDYGSAYTQNAWYNIVTTYNNMEVSSYINWTFIYSLTYSRSETTGTLRINWAVDTTSSNYRCAWWLSELIIEDKVRTAAEISDYYNNTKSNYWL